MRDLRAWRPGVLARQTIRAAAAVDLDFAARNATALAFPEMAGAIKKFWFYDLRAKAADDTSDDRGDQAASDLLGNDSVRTTQKPYLKRGKIVAPTR